MLKEAERGYRTIEVTPEPSGFGARVTGVDLSQPLPAAVLDEVKAAWAAHAVLAFPNQPVILAWQGVMQPAFSLVGVGGALIGLGGMLLAFLKAGKPLLSKATIFAVLPLILFLMTLFFVAGFRYA